MNEFLRAMTENFFSSTHLKFYYVEVFFFLRKSAQSASSCAVNEGIAKSRRSVGTSTKCGAERCGTVHQSAPGIFFSSKSARKPELQTLPGAGIIIQHNRFTFFKCHREEKFLAMAHDKAEKKRKRDSDRHEWPSKKPALEPQNLPPLAASVVEDDSELAPVLGVFHSF